MTAPRRKARPRDVLVALGGMFVLVGAALYGINATDTPPTLESLDRTSTTVRTPAIHRLSRGAPYLTVGTDAGTYTLASYGSTWLDSLARALPAGSAITVWSRPVPNGWGQIWQLTRGDSMVVAYAERRHAKEFSNRRTGQLAIGMLVLGALALAAGISLRVSVRVT